MNGINIVFGQKRLGKKVVAVRKEKYPEHSVVTIEAERGPKKSRRVFFNNRAAEDLNLPLADVQELVFGTAVGEDGDNLLFVMNKEHADTEQEMQVYKTSKNTVPLENQYKEKSKAVTSSALCVEISEWLNLTGTAELILKPIFGSDEDEANVAFSLSVMELGVDLDVVEPEEVKTEASIEDNNGNEMTGSDVVSNVQEEVMKAEAAAEEEASVEAVESEDPEFQNETPASELQEEAPTSGFPKRQQPATIEDFEV